MGATLRLGLVIGVSVALLWMESRANSSKQSRSAAYVTGADPQWIQAQVELESITRERLLSLISRLALFSN
jgi:hypothetical protein